MRRALAIASLLAALAALAAAVSGCGLGPGEEQASEGSLTVTRDFGAESLGRKVSSAGAGDRSARRLRAGDRLLWFYCRTQRAGGCQRTLEATPDRTTAAPGEMVRVTVRGYDDQGKGVAVQGATVRLGSASAVSGADGVAVLTVPAASGTLRLQAERSGMVRAFPRETAVG